MVFDPNRRPTASQALQYPFFQVNIQIASAMPALGRSPNMPVLTSSHGRSSHGSASQSRGRSGQTFGSKQGLQAAVNLLPNYARPVKISQSTFTH